MSTTFTSLTTTREAICGDLYVSTLRRYIEAIGGRLEIHAVFPDLDAELRFDDFEAIDRDNPDISDDSELREAL